jgi:hypothetical protein
MHLESRINKQKDKTEIEQIVLLGKDDVFNADFNKSALEHEML